MTDPCLAASHRYCRVSTRGHAKSFYFSSFVLPPGKRAAAYAIYAFCRYADDAIDVACEQADVAKKAALANLREDFEGLMAGDKNVMQRLPFACAFVETVRSYKIPEQLFRDLIHGVGLDIGRVRIGDFAELETYCYYVASVVGLIMARVFGLKEGDKDGELRAIHLGQAMQITNILRDVEEDFARDRIYLPATLMALHGVAEEDLARANATPGLKKIVHHLATEARRLYEDAEAGIVLLDDDGSQLAVWTMRYVYAGILDEIERLDWDVLAGRASTGLPRKLLLAMKARRALAVARKGRRLAA